MVKSLMIIIIGYLMIVGADWYSGSIDNKVKRYEDEQVTCRVLVWSYYGVAISCVEKSK